MGEAELRTTNNGPMARTASSSPAPLPLYIRAMLTSNTTQYDQRPEQGAQAPALLPASLQAPHPTMADSSLYMMGRKILGYNTWFGKA
ncbi:hypothetical protein RRF57_002994 [Xylaria bambusicola]|uniref:Uncharacterized protein n=1 Tax=Xylaria bambusicola TaxID=326684 RepID=A0AAN7UDY9_9PEZI